MGCCSKTQLVRTLLVLKAIVTILIFKVALGIFDVGSDIVNGYNFLSGQFKLVLYFACVTREEYDQLPDLAKFGYLIICLPWLPGLLKILFLISLDSGWEGLRWSGVVYRIVGNCLFLFSWPIVQIMM